MSKHPGPIHCGAGSCVRSAREGRAATGRSHNEWGFSNRMLDATIDLMSAK